MPAGTDRFALRLLTAAAFAAALAGAPPACGGEDPPPWTPPILRMEIDPNGSAEIGAEDALTLRYAAGRLEDRVLKPRLWEEEGFWSHLGGFGYRYARSWLLDQPIGYGMTVVQHEVFGHGYRGRENGYRDIRYRIGLPPPYGRGGGTTYWKAPQDSLYPPDRTVAVTLAGEEAQGVEADLQRLYWIQAGAMDARGAQMYVENSLSLWSYLQGTHEGDLDNPDPDFGNDMLAYVFSLNGKEEPGPREEWRLHVRRIREQAGLMAALDPFLWYSFWTMDYRHLWRGESYWRYPAVPAGPLRLLPALAYGLGPWGPEYRFQILCAWDGRGLSAGYRVGDDTFRHSFGWDAASLGLARIGGWILDGDLHYWMQPRLLLDPSRMASAPAPRRSGTAAALSVLSRALGATLPVRLSASAGWKSGGFVAGEDLRSGPYGRIGVAWTPGLAAAEP